jgi:class 3 adenylate cyclase
VLIVELISGRNQHMSDYKGGGPDGRRLVAVVHADMVGYSRLIELDDTRTLARLRALRATLFDPTIARFGGRIVQTAGDSLLMFFDSVTDAVNCAVRLQQALPDHDPAHSSDRAIICRARPHNRSSDVPSYQQRSWRGAFGGGQ